MITRLTDELSAEKVWSSSAPLSSLHSLCNFSTLLCFCFYQQFWSQSQSYSRKYLRSRRARRMVWQREDNTKQQVFSFFSSYSSTTSSFIFLTPSQSEEKNSTDIERDVLDVFCLRCHVFVLPVMCIVFELTKCKLISYIRLIKESEE